MSATSSISQNEPIHYFRQKINCRGPKMSSYHKPKVFRSVEGCCICKAKSSSSRFTDSGKYESAFSACFKVAESARSGDICNACVLIVKRWRNLPRDTDKDWSHVVNSRE